MKKYYTLIVLTLFFCGCLLTDKPSKQSNIKLDDTTSTVTQLTDTVIKLRKLDKLFTVGDFDGDGHKDTIFEHNFSRLSKTEIDSSADPSKYEFDIIWQWLYKQDADLYLAFNKDNQDTLHLGISGGLHCLFNLGDINLDGKDELAFVKDNCDVSRLNSCRIYSMCNKKWTALKFIGINENVFIFDPKTETLPTTGVKGYLERQNNKWVYYDNFWYFDGSHEDTTMQILKLDKCK